MIQKKEITEEGAYMQLASLCARGEHCRHDMMEKMRRWGMSEEAQARVVERLVRERYVDEERYTRAFVHDKLAYNKWGRRKIEQALWMKHIDEEISQRVLDEVADADYVAALRTLLQQKRRCTRASSSYELNQKLVRFALSRGFTYDIVMKSLSL